LLPDRADLRPLVVLTVAVVAMAASRFAALTPDSHHYLALVGHFEGAADASLVAPFVYRVAIPWLVAALPLADNAVEFAVISTAATMLGHLVVYRLAVALTGRRDLAFIGTLACAVSPVVFTYGGRVLTDGPAFLFAALSVWLIRSDRVVALVVLLAAAMLVREAIIAMWVTLGAIRLTRALSSRSIRPLLVLGAVAVPVAVVLAVRAAFTDVPSYTWAPTMQRLVANLTRPLTWSACLAAVAPFVVVFVIAAAGGGDLRPWRRLSPDDCVLLLAHLFAVSLLVVAAMTSAFMSPRFFWPAFIVVAPLVGWMVDGTFLQRFAARVCGGQATVVEARP